MEPTRRFSLLRAAGPGLLLAATGVGAGDLATGAFSGSTLGLGVLWAVLIGAVIKYVLCEGLTRWQLVTGQTLLAGALLRVRRSARWLFLLYLLPWSWFVGGALISACGATAHAMLPVCETPEQGKVVFGIAHSLVGLVLVWRGGFALFERMMSVCIGLMFVTVIATAILLEPDWSAVLRGMFLPSIPDGGGEGVAWTIALIGGVGGTLTILCYGYWIREAGREDPDQLGLCRVDLGVGYLVTALFGLAMVVIGSTIEIEGRGAGLLVQLADRLEGPLGRAGRWVFLVGAWGAVFSSLLGVWQAVPYLFADWWRLTHAEAEEERGGAVDTGSAPYRGYLLAIAIVPLVGLGVSFQAVQKAYAVIGALFLPILAVVLLLLNGRRDWITRRYRNSPLTVIVLVSTLAFFLLAGGLELARKLG